VEAPAAETTSSEEPVRQKELMERIDNDREFLQELVDLFSQDCPVQVQNAREAITKGDAATLQKTAHALKGALGNLGAATASGRAYELEVMGKNGDLSAANEKLSEVEQEATRALEVLQGMCLEAAW
jgi:HPt (histidine-containing phosphotransfer) domain-containing protein